MAPRWLLVSPKSVFDFPSILITPCFPDCAAFYGIRSYTVFSWCQGHRWLSLQPLLTALWSFLWTSLHCSPAQFHLLHKAFLTMQPVEISLDLSLYIFIYLSVLVLIAVCRIFSCSIRALSCCMQDLVPDQWLNHGPLHWQHTALAAGQPVTSLDLSLSVIYILHELTSDSVCTGILFNGGMVDYPKTIAECIETIYL